MIEIIFSPIELISEFTHKSQQKFLYYQFSRKQNDL
jgi:hypothetical protein